MCFQRGNLAGGEFDFLADSRWVCPFCRGSDVDMVRGIHDDMVSKCNGCGVRYDFDDYKFRACNERCLPILCGVFEGLKEAGIIYCKLSEGGRWLAHVGVEMGIIPMAVYIVEDRLIFKSFRKRPHFYYEYSLSDPGCFGGLIGVAVELQRICNVC